MSSFFFRLRGPSLKSPFSYSARSRFERTTLAFPSTAISSAVFQSIPQYLTSRPGTIF
uniref:hypothetical protein n=1 Tax=Corynebacterium cystitidis TaxID=35757 RepID=UPI00115FFD20